MSKRFIGPVFVEFKNALKDNDLKSARRLKQELYNLYRKKPKLPPFHRAAEMLYDSKAGKETECITEARYLAKLPDLYAEIAESVIDTFEKFNYPEELIEYLDDVHKRFKNDRNTTENLFTHLLLNSRFNQAQIVAMELYRIKKTTLHGLYAAAAAFLRARSIDDEIEKYEKLNLNPDQIENLKKQRQLYYNFAIKLVSQSEDKCIDGLQITIESLIELEQYDNAISILNENKDATFSPNMLTFYRLMIKCLERKKKDDNQIAETALKIIEEINSDSIDEWRLIVKYHTNPEQIIEKYIEKYRGAFLAKIELELKQVLNKNDLETHVNQFYQFVLDYSNKYANKSFTFDDLLPYFALKKDNQADTSIPILSTISILSKNDRTFLSAITDEMRSKLIEVLKGSNDLSVRSYANGNFAASDKEIQLIKNLNKNSEIENHKVLPIYLEYKIHQYKQTKDANNLYQPLSLLFKLNEKQPNGDKHVSITKIINDQLNFDFEKGILNKEVMAILVRCFGLLGLTQIQRDLFYASLRVDSIQFLSLAPMIVPDLIRNWDLLTLSEYQRRVNDFSRLSLSTIMNLMTTILGFNRKNFFASFDLIQLKKDLELNEVSYFFILLRFLTEGGASLNIQKDVDQLFNQSENINEVLPADPGCSTLNEFNFKKVAPYQREIVDRYYGKYDVSIYPVYFNDEELQQALFPTKRVQNSPDLISMNQFLYEVNYAVNLIFLLKFEKDKIALASISHNQNNNNDNSKNALNDVLAYADNNDNLGKNWKIVAEFVKSGSLDLYNSNNTDNEELSLLQIFTLVAVSLISRKDKKGEIAKIVEKEGQKVINRINKQFDVSVPTSVSDDLVDVETIKSWKETVGKTLFENQIKAVNYTIDQLKVALNK